ncbi:unnamed protein product [Phaedon cochleariae]|uniref:BRCT domain-containing protein n=1 Tax=Phaedon cochleariae TaxID=80249 RepID=A0A9P0GVS8_PHACE|nr:unnamed protein product [Phaedon cochleariae]
MPVLKIDHIVSFSSEDPAHPASNILASDNTKKWKCRTSGEKNAVVILQLEKASQISAIDIGNQNSAYVEVLVSRTGSSEDYKVLLAASSFMTPIEARSSQNMNKVRMFTKEQLLKPQVDEKWDRVKIVCTQPFNKHCQYGLAFVNLVSFDGGDGNSKAAPVQQNIGKFALRPESPDDFTAGSLFAKRKEVKQEQKLTGAAAIREASSSSSLALHGSPVCKPKLKTKDLTPASKKGTGDSAKGTPKDKEKGTPKDRNRNELFYDEDDEKPNEKIDKVIKKKADEAKQKEEVEDVKKKQNFWDSKKKDASPSTSKVKVAKVESPKKESKRKIKEETPKAVKKKRVEKEKPSKPFEKLLDGVTLVISGIQNPDRANLRTMALSMGAKYKADWDSTCTHLICAFPNTPKFNQVKGKGKIVKRSWVEDSHVGRKRLPWRRYALDRDDQGCDESEGEILERVDSARVETIDRDVESDGMDMDVDEHKDEGSDTEEKVAKLLEEQKQKNGSKEIVGSDYDIYEADTDVEDLF